MIDIFVEKSNVFITKKYHDLIYGLHFHIHYSHWYQSKNGCADQNGCIYQAQEYIPVDYLRP